MNDTPSAMRGLVLDFDGVVFNSAPEAYRVARRAYADLGPARASVTPLPTPGEVHELRVEQVLADPLYQGFVELMPLGGRAEDYAVILSCLERGVVVRDQEGYDRQRDQVPAEYQEAYHARFYEVRTGFQEQHPERWRALQGPYPEVVALIRRHSSDVALAIATAKDRRSVRLLLEDHGLAGLFPDERLMDKDTGRSKAAHLRQLERVLGIPLPDMTFVDDKVNHLDAVAPLGVRCVLAAWGYNGAREQELARGRGYIVCALDDAEGELFTR
jgi:phosphoglycolate phosphatase-like HAD superfamily hydrolase